MPPGLVEPDRLGAIQLHKLTIDARANESFALELFDHIPELARLILDERRQHHDFGVGFVREDLIDDLLRRLAAQRPTGQGIMRLTDSRKKDPQIIVNFSGGRDCRPRIGAGTALLDRNRGGQSLDKIDIWLFHLIEELPRISGETLYVSALPLGIKSVESQRGFPEPLSPVMTTNFSRGISTWRFLRLCWRAPLILMTCAGILTRNVEPISQAQLRFFSSDIGLRRAISPLMAKTASLPYHRFARAI